tara:strand:+ start:1131 stop:2333 length:1203 start_codon:yes stop_codon:yes gene_type:complete
MMRLRVLFAAPHRLLFLVGVLQFAATIGWWAASLIEFLGFGSAMPTLVFPPTFLHAPILLFLVFPSLFFGFLLTVFPRWTGFRDAGGVVYVPVALAFFASAVALWLGLSGILVAGILAAFGQAALGWLWAVGYMVYLIWQERRAGKAPTWHAWSIVVATAIGFTCLVLAIAGLRRQDALLVHIASIAALDLFLMPVFVTVCHRMVPFFAGNVVPNYTPWRPYWVLLAFWFAEVASFLGFGVGIPWISIAGRAFATVLTAMMLWKWWPRAAAPGLLWILVIGFAWAPVGFAVSTWTGVFAPELGRAAIHLQTVGFAASLVVAMVTRVTQGHSGRPLMMPATAWFAFAIVQVATLLRLFAAIRGEDLLLLVLSALCLFAGLVPWAARGIWIYLNPRIDGRQG